MHSDSGDRVVLDGLKEGQADAFSFDFEVNDDVVRAAFCEELRKGLGIHLEVPVLGTASINDGRQPAFAAHLIEATDAGARCCFECGFLGHDGKGGEVGMIIPQSF